MEQPIAERFQSFVIPPSEILQIPQKLHIFEQLLARIGLLSALSYPDYAIERTRLHYEEFSRFFRDNPSCSFRVTLECFRSELDLLSKYDSGLSCRLFQVDADLPFEYHVH